MTHHTIAFLAPEIPALSATFVYEELLGIERRGFSVIPISVHRPVVSAGGHSALAARTVILYDGAGLTLALGGLLGLHTAGNRLKPALKWLAADMVDVGLLKARSWKLGFQFLAAVKLARVLKRHGCVHLHVHFAHVPAQIAMYASALSGVPFTLTGHANDIFERGLLLATKAARARKFLTISEYNREWLQLVGVDADKLAVVRCGVSFAASLRANSTGTRDRYRLGTLGRMVEKKGMDVLLRAVAELRGRQYSIELSIAGDGPLRGSLEILVGELGLTESVRFEGNLAHSDVSTWMRNLDLFVLACKQDTNGDMDGIPVVLMEAMSQGVAVVSTRLSGIPELVLHGQTGLLADPGDHRDLARQIDRFLASDDLRKAAAERAIEHVEAEFGSEVNLDRLTGHFGLAAAPKTLTYAIRSAHHQPNASIPEVLTRTFRLVRTMHPELTARSLKKHVTLLVEGLMNLGEIRRWFAISDNPRLLKAQERFPLISGAIYWPYVNRAWLRATRLAAIEQHYRLLDGSATIIANATLAEVELVSFNEEYAGLRLVLDKAIWFLREGEIVLNLFVHDRRIFSLAFTLGLDADQRLVFVGALQGSKGDGANDIYRDITHSLHGMRPRDLLMTALKLLCIEVGIRKIWAISTEDRQHNSPYFGNSHKEKVLVNYDEVWIEHGGRALNNGFFEIPAVVDYRETSQIPSRKRSMYRLRYQMLDRAAMEIKTACSRHAALATGLG